jgi:hypothetical protein
MHNGPHLRFKARWRNFEGRAETKVVGEKPRSSGELNRFNCEVFCPDKPLQISSLMADFSTENPIFAQPSETNDLGKTIGESAANKT